MDLERIGDWLKGSIKWIGIGVSVILILVLGVLLVDSKRETEEKKKLEVELDEQTVPYLKEISDIQNDIAAKKKELEEMGAGSVVSAAFVISSVEEAEKVRDLTVDMAMPVSVVLNDSMELQEAREVLSIFSDQKYGMILTGKQLLSGGWKHVDQMGELLLETGHREQPAFLLMIKEDNEENLENLKERGYTSLLRYRTELDSGKTEQGQYFFPYSVIKEVGVTEDRVNQLVKKSANMFFLFHMEAVEKELMTEAEMRDAVAVLKECEEEGKFQIRDLAGMETALQEQMEKKSALQQEFEAYEAEQNKKIEELERAIDEIYAE